jgi:hypothetical protein
MKLQRALRRGKFKTSDDDVFELAAQVGIR